VIATEFYSGQGLGNQLWCYVTSRVIAIKLGYDFSVISPEKFKGHLLFALNLGSYVAPQSEIERKSPETLKEPLENHYSECRTFDAVTGLDTSDLDQHLLNLPPNSKLDGNFQQVMLIEDSKELISDWLKVDPPTMDLANTCVINFRGGEYYHHKRIFLPFSYWRNAIKYIKSIYPDISFLVVTDDTDLARRYFPDFQIAEFPMEEDYRCIAHARVLILSNSSFAWFPAWLNESVELCVAPMYWWGFNSGFWSTPGVIVPNWHFLSKEGEINTFSKAGNYADCKKLKGPVQGSVNSALANILSSLALRSRLIGVRRRKSRIMVWILIFLRKILGSFILNGIHNKYRVFHRKLTYTRAEKKISKVEFYLRRRKNSQQKVVDLFLFFNELDLLELRIQTLWDYVDSFIICESTTTFTGIQKESFFLLHQKRFEKYMSKIIHLQNHQSFLTQEEVRQKIYSSTNSRERDILSRCLTDSNVPEGHITWLNEYFQKEIAIGWIDQLADETIVMVSDVDEIWNPKRFLVPQDREVIVYKQTPYVYFMNLESNEHWNNWNGTVSALARTWKNNGINASRTHRRMSRAVIPKGGWHFSFQGGKDFIFAKLAAYGHQELNTEANRAKFDVSINQITELRGISPKLSKNDKLSKSILRDFRNHHPDWFIS